ncbi:hypothetical protein CPB83DRAFT_860921 [Crepidotus variabilis]|uniref:PHD-type domain-containing protein n=1 Tax=Crepidotus variabilis TaxID=179855 RepID=A0A9P6E905_9AGAR|nr:hypothetical protein CPB83DRAFT_860921 [Crepidotus variabilis]
MSTSNVAPDKSSSFSEQVDGLLPAFSTRPYSQLPTPQSPNTLSRYLDDRPSSPETPVPHSASLGSSSHAPSTSTERHEYTARKLPRADSVLVSQHMTQQYATPESSPQFQHPASTSNLLMTPRNLFNHSTSNFATPQQTPLKLESPAPRAAVSAPYRPPSPLSSSPIRAHSIPSSTLSSPFMGKISLNGHTQPSKDKSSTRRFPDDLPFIPARAPSIPETSASSVSPPGESSEPIVPAGGEMERIRQTMLEEQITHLQEAERRRPDYMRRSQRTSDDSEPSYYNDTTFDSEPWPAVGVMDSPLKGRRLTLFQETSEESFEESLMAGGYGRYRTADWVRQPQPLPVNVSGSATPAPRVEVEEAQLTEKEIKKRKRLAAFSLEPQSANAKLYPIELEGKGRVLLDTPAFGDSGSPEPSPSKRRTTTRRKRRTGTMDKKGAYLSGSEDDQTGKPNWPDAEFPWKVRADERVEEAKAQEEDRLRWIERYLDRDSDDEDEEMPYSHPVRPEPSSAVYRHQIVSSYQARPGRGKSIPLPVAPDDPWNIIPRVPFPVDSGDAREALLSKKSVRTLSYRHQKRLREEADDGEDEDELCICHGKDDGRQLVQCDLCQTWYHLDCIGIKRISDLGKEEDPWYCDTCHHQRRSPSTEPENYPTSEPTFVPTEPSYHGQRYADVSLTHPLSQESPAWVPSRPPKTPTRGTRHTYSESSRTTLADPSRHLPSTPQRPVAAYRSFGSIGPSNAIIHKYVEDPPFDPMSTPSRGLQFSAWSQRPSSIFQTPGPPELKFPGSARLLQLGHSASVDDAPLYQFPRVLGAEESPIRRNKSSDASYSRRRFPSPPRSQMPPNLYDSPVVRAVPSQMHRT